VAAAGAAALVIAVGCAAVLTVSRGTIDPTARPAGSANGTASAIAALASATNPATALLPSHAPSPTDFPFVPINMIAPRGPAVHEVETTDRPIVIAPSRPLPGQSIEWLTAKASGRVAQVGGVIVLLDRTFNPMLMPATGLPIPAARTLDVSWTRWIVEPPGYGVDEKGTRYTDTSFWNLCGPGSATVALYYWQQLNGRPNVTGTAGWFLDPYAAEGVAWPSPGPIVGVSGGKRIGTYWSGSDRVSGFTANGRGFLMYMAMQVQPAGWKATGIAVFADADGKPVYPTWGASKEQIATGANWEISGHASDGWADGWYGPVNTGNKSMARDLNAAVMMDVGRDGVPVIGAVDVSYLPNWQSGSTTPHTRHAIAIVGYDNTANPPTYSYLDTCGRACNARSGNQNGKVHVIAQSAMVQAMQDGVGDGFVW
jgi:hypothetical protein